MGTVKKIIIIGFSFFIVTFAITGCKASNGSTRGPLDVKRVIYIAGGGDTGFVNVYEITPNEVSFYDYTSYRDEHNGDEPDYFADDITVAEEYLVSIGDVSESDWTHLVLNLTRVNFMELQEELPEPEEVRDGMNYYILVETADDVNKSGGYEAGYNNDSDNRRFRQVRDAIQGIIKAEEHSIEQQLEDAVKNDLFKNIGFDTFTYKEGTEGWKKKDAEHDVEVAYCTGQNGEVLSLISGEVNGDELEICINKNIYEVRLRGEGFSYMCHLSADDLSLLEPAEYARDYAMIFEIRGVSLKNVEDLINIYSELTQKYLESCII